MRKAYNETLTDGIAGDEDDWNTRRRSLGRSRCSESVGSEHIDRESDEFGGQLRITGGVAARVPLLDDKIATFGPAEFLESLPKRTQGEGFGIGKQPPDGDFTSLLRPISQRRENRESENDREPDPPQWAPRLGWWVQV